MGIRVEHRGIRRERLLDHRQDAGVSLGGVLLRLVLLVPVQDATDERRDACGSSENTIVSGPGCLLDTDRGPATGHLSQTKKIAGLDTKSHTCKPIEGSPQAPLHDTACHEVQRGKRGSLRALDSPLPSGLNTAAGLHLPPPPLETRQVSF